MEILKFPDPRLFDPTWPVTVFGDELKVLLDSMWDVMVANYGVGLAANQVGLTFSMFTMEGAEGERLYIVNPRIKSKSSAPANLREGCLSAPGEFLTRPDRAVWVELEFQDELGVPQRRVFKGIAAVCVQHEIEHLNGEGFMQSKTILKQKRLQLAKKWNLPKAPGVFND